MQALRPITLKNFQKVISEVKIMFTVLLDFASYHGKYLAQNNRV